MGVIRTTKNIIGSLLRDIIVLGSGDFIEYTVERNVSIYKSWLPFNISIGNYVFDGVNSNFSIYVPCEFYQIPSGLL